MEEPEKLDNFFKMLDKNKTGKISIAEFENCLGRKLSKNEINAII
jgi:Ca2+-binding EF-hand superfamily protein